MTSGYVNAPGNGGVSEHVGFGQQFRTHGPCLPSSKVGSYDVILCYTHIGDGHQSMNQDLLLISNVLRLER